MSSSETVEETVSVTSTDAAVIDAAAAAATSAVLNAAVATAVGGKTLDAVRKVFVRFCFVVIILFLTEAIILIQRYFSIATSEEGYDYSFVNMLVAALRNNTAVSATAAADGAFAK